MFSAHMQIYKTYVFRVYTSLQSTSFQLGTASRSKCIQTE